MTRLIAIAGPTASGKTSLGIQLARRLGGEIVNGDSQQVYKHFDIGTGKPTAEQLATVQHHLISVVEPLEPFSAARYQHLADAAIAEILGRNREAMIVGGTGLYIRALLHGLMPAPPRDLKLRARLVEEAKQAGREALHRRLAAIDPDAAQAIHPSDLVRIVRALEIHELTGARASEHRQRHAFSQDRYRYRLFVLNPNRAELNQAIEQRVRGMFAAGLVEEVQRLVKAGFRDAPAMRSVGYAEALSVLDGSLSLEEAVSKTVQSTRRYAKRQWTWFRKEARAEFVPPSLEAILDALERP